MSTTETPATAGWDPTWAKIATHPMRLRILQAVQAHGEVSPSTLAQELDERLGNVSYHVRTLLNRGMLELKRTEPRRGAVEHYYAVTPRAAAMLPANEGHRVEITFESGFGARARLICPPTGCKHPVDEGVEDTSVPCWIQTWFENLGVELVDGTIVVPVTSVTADGEDGVTVHIGEEAGVPA